MATKKRRKRATAKNGSSALPVGKWIPGAVRRTATGKIQFKTHAVRVAKNPEYVVWPSGRPFSSLAKAKAHARALVKENGGYAYVENAGTQKTIYKVGF